VFWSGTQADYFQFYRATAVAVKSVHDSLRVGGPATSSTQWIAPFLAFCQSENAPLDFVSTHIYAGDAQGPLFGPGTKLPVTAVIPEAIKRVRQTIAASTRPTLPLYIDEWSSDSPAMIAHVLANVLGQADMMSHWVLSGTYEELGPSDYLLAPGSMSWPQMMRGIPLPSYHTYTLLHRLGHQRLEADGPVLASRREDGGMAALVWNLAEVAQPAGLPDASVPRKVTGEPSRIALAIPDLPAGQHVRVTRIDMSRGSPIPAWQAMGAPKLPTSAQVEHLRAAAVLPAPELRRLDAQRSLVLDLPPEGVALVETA
jgi:xylan 1,4-beta-xylosidase